MSRARTALVEELGLEPGPSLRRLENDVLLQSPSLDWTPPAATASPTCVAVEPDRGRVEPAPDVPPAAEGLLVGRDPELAQLERRPGRRRRRQESDRAAVRVSPGIGKTRLAEELARRATARGALVAWG